jgi:hypothetical protein
LDRHWRHPEDEGAQVSADLFLKTLAQGLGSEERLIICGFKGDPQEAPSNAWRPRPWKPGMVVPFNERHNAYVAVSSFVRDHDGRWNRRGDFFSAGLSLMIDDVGTSESSKVHPSKVKGHEPTACIETSHKNFQLWYCLKVPERNQARFGAVIRAFISGQLLGADPGMAGVNRVGRIPGFVNAKPKHNGWVTKLTHLNPKRRFSIDDLCTMFDLTLTVPPPLRVVPNETAERNIETYKRFVSFLRRRGMLKRGANPSGWTPVHCPWSAGHTNGADNGAAIREPRPENNYVGAYHCCHGSCAGRGWKDLTDWIVERFEEELSDHG